MQKKVLNCYQYFCTYGKKYGAVNDTDENGSNTVANIVKRGVLTISRRECVHQERDKFRKASHFWK